MTLMSTSSQSMTFLQYKRDGITRHQNIGVHQSKASRSSATDPNANSFILGTGDPHILDRVPTDTDDLSKVTLESVQQDHFRPNSRELANVHHVVTGGICKLISVHTHTRRLASASAVALAATVKMTEVIKLLSLPVVKAIFQVNLDLIGARDDGGGADNWSYKMCKAPVASNKPITSNKTTLYSK